jgi:hypothetical protein
MKQDTKDSIQIILLCLLGIAIMLLVIKFFFIPIGFDTDSILDATGHTVSSGLLDKFDRYTIFLIPLALFIVLIIEIINVSKGKNGRNKATIDSTAKQP